MPQPEHFDVLVLGSGQGGQLIAWHLAQAGPRAAALVERRWVAGSCPMIACMPSKNEALERQGGASRPSRCSHSAWYRGRRHNRHGDGSAPQARHGRHEVELHLQNFRATGTELIIGHGRFVAPKTLEVSLNDGGTRVLAGDQVFLNLGTHAGHTRHFRA